MLRCSLVLLVLVALVGACSPAPRPAPLPTEATTTRLAYGDLPDQWVDLAVPAGTGPFGVVVLLHGGYWYEQYRADLMEALASDAVARGWAAANVEYRRVGGAGGWPATFEDVAAAIDLLADADDRLDLDRVAVVGHSAGGHLALWSAGRARLASGAPGADPRVQPCAVVGQAAVSDLTEGARLGLGGGAVQDLLGGGPADVPDRYDVADPARLLPLEVPVLLVHGRGDRIVPPSLTEEFAAAASAAGDDVTTFAVDGDHFVVLDPAAEPWGQTMDWLERSC